MPHKERNMHILSMHDKGYSLTAIAKRVNLSPTRVRQILKLIIGKRARANSEDTNGV